jgi:hypothetical protein
MNERRPDLTDDELHEFLAENVAVGGVIDRDYPRTTALARLLVREVLARRSREQAPPLPGGRPLLPRDQVERQLEILRRLVTGLLGRPGHAEALGALDALQAELWYLRDRETRRPRGPGEGLPEA